MWMLGTAKPGRRHTDAQLAIPTLGQIQEKNKMEKYGVEIDPKKVADAKKKKAGEKTASVNDPNVNVPKDDNEGTEPFEKKPEDD